MPEDKQKKKRCFVVGPIGEPDGEIRIHADWVLEEIIQPVLAEFPDFIVIRADQIAQPGMIDAQVIQHLLDSELVIADLSRENPNAFYEIGIRHMAQKPIIHMQLAGESIPFDVSLYRAMKFSRARPVDLRNAREELKRAVQAVLAEDYKVDNPVTRARGQIRLEETATPEQKLVMNELRAIQDRLNMLEEESESVGQVSSRTRVRVVPPRSTRKESSYVHLDTKRKGLAALQQKVMDVIERQGLSSALDGKLVHFIVPQGFFDGVVGKLLLKELMAIPGVHGIWEIPF